MTFKDMMNLNVPAFDEFYGSRLLIGDQMTNYRQTQTDSGLPAGAENPS